MKDTAAVPRGERPADEQLIHNGGCVSGKYAVWMDKLGAGSVAEVQSLLDEHDIDPVTDTAGRAADEKYNRSENHEAYLCLSAADACTLLNEAIDTNA